MLTSFDTLDTEKCWLLAILLKAEGDIYEDQGNASESYYSYIRSLNLFLEVLLLGSTNNVRSVVPEIDDLLAGLSDYDLPKRTSFSFSAISIRLMGTQGLRAFSLRCLKQVVLMKIY